MASPIVRPYAGTDRAACRELWVELTETHRELYDDPTIGGDDPGHGFDVHLERPDLHALWVAEADGAILGLAGILVGDGKAELEPVVVAGDRRGVGVGRLLVETAIAAARELGVPSSRSARSAGTPTRSASSTHSASTCSAAWTSV